MHVLLKVLLVAFGGALGAVIRYLVQCSRFDFVDNFPSSTLLVNLLGCFCAGCLLPLVAFLPNYLKLFILTGLLGGLTTFSSFSLEAVHLMQAGRFHLALSYVGMSVGGGLIFCSLGVYITQRLIS